jgi:hypothetical protein
MWNVLAFWIFTLVSSISISSSLNLWKYFFVLIFLFRFVLKANNDYFYTRQIFFLEVSLTFFNYYWNLVFNKQCTFKILYLNKTLKVITRFLARLNVFHSCVSCRVWVKTGKNFFSKYTANKNMKTLN